MTVIPLSREQVQTLSEQGRESVRLLDPNTNQIYVLVQEEAYQRLRNLLYDDGSLDIREAYPLLDEMAAKAGWDDPSMDIYNDLAAGRKP